MKKLIILLLLLPVIVFGQLPTVTTNPTITNNTTGLRVDAGGTVTSEGGSAVTQRGIVWSTSPNPTRSIIPTTDKYANTSGTGLGAFTDYAAPLRPSTTYYIRAFATNATGTAYGSDVTFTTPSGRAPSKFYFNNITGNDNNNGSISTPWKTLSKLNSLINSGNVTFVPGDTIFFARGSTFTGPFQDNFSGFYWVQRPQGGFTSPSGTPQNPIVLTSYGDLAQPKPNFLSPYTTPPQSFWPNTRQSRHIWQFSGVSNIVIDGLQSNDNRPTAPAVSDKRSPGTSGGWLMGEWTKSLGYTTTVNGKTVYVVTRPGSRDPAARNSMIDSFVVRNCVFTNTTYGFSGIAATNSIFEYDTITNLKSSADTAGVNDVFGAAFEATSGIGITVRNCYVKGAWAKSGRISSTGGLGGVGIDAFTLYNSKFIYNTFIDCSGFIEIGNIDTYDSLAGSQYDTFAFNKIINSDNVATVHGRAGDPFRGNNHHLYFWNNTVVSNNLDRFRGVGFGRDTYNDGQGFLPGLPGAFWFCRRPYNTLNVAPITPDSTVTTAGSNRVLVSSITGIRVGTVAFIENDSLLGRNYQTVTVTAIDTINRLLTLSVPATQSRTVRPTNQYKLQYYLPVADQTWSQPENFATSDFVWNTTVCLIGGDNTTEWGNNIDTLVDTRNNLFYWTNGNGGIKNQSRYKRSSNIYSPIGGVRGPTTLGPPATGGAVLNATGTNERQITTQSIFTDTTAAYPENWDLKLATPLRTSSVALPTPGINKDFAGVTYTEPFIGLFQYQTTSTLQANATYSAIACNGGSSTVTVTATGGTPPYTGIGQFVTTAGNYSYTVTDNAGAASSATGTITQPTAVTATPTISTIQCNGYGTNILISANGGTPPYTGTGTFVRFAGPYSFVVTDTNGCVSNTITGTLTQPTLLNAAVAVGTITQNGGNTTATVTAAGGTPPYRYKLNNGNYQSGNILTGVIAGQQTVTTIDNNGCTTTNTINVSQPGPAGRRSRLYFINAQ